MISLLNLKNTINIAIENEQEFVDNAIRNWNVADLSFHNGQIAAYNKILSEIDFILDS